MMMATSHILTNSPWKTTLGFPGRTQLRRRFPFRVVCKKAVGIDLGSTNSAVATMKNGMPVIITDSKGNTKIPSVVVYANGELLVGHLAKTQGVVNPENTFSSFNKFVGKKMSELDEEEETSKMQVVGDRDGNVTFHCPVLGKEFTPEEISAKVLMKLVENASRFLNEPVSKAVFTVPAYFNSSQRMAIKEAARIAGLDVLQIMNEPIAASLAYGFDNKTNETILVIDLGGCTFHVSVVEAGDGVLKVLSASGDTHLGGHDFDKRIVDWVAKKFNKDEGIDLLKDREALQLLNETAERVKIELSTHTQTNISLPFVTTTVDGPKHIESTLTRAKFEVLCSDLVDRLKAPLQTAVTDAKLSFEDIDEVILVGGSTRIPAVQDLIKKMTGKEACCSVNPDEVVALGAAIQAGILGKEVSDVTVLSIGVETLGGVMTKIIPRNTLLPISKSYMFSTASDGQSSVEVSVFQGEREFVKDNKSFGTFRFTGIPPSPRGVPQIELKFDMDVTGMLSVTALETGTGNMQVITIPVVNDLPEHEVEKVLKEGEMFGKVDKERRDAIETRNQAVFIVYRTEKHLKELGEKVPIEVKENIEAKLDELRNVISCNESKVINEAMIELNHQVMQLGESIYNQPRPIDASRLD